MIPVLSVCQSRQSAHFFVTESCTTIYVDEQFNLAYYAISLDSLTIRA